MLRGTLVALLGGGAAVVVAATPASAATCPTSTPPYGAELCSGSVWLGSERIIVDGGKPISTAGRIHRHLIVADKYQQRGAFLAVYPDESPDTGRAIAYRDPDGYVGDAGHHDIYYPVKHIRFCHDAVQQCITLF
ncbi:hypothetical protein [Actinoplanes teichomyceticus]|uniref:hypothetical protein n=1 Tax=Actinoplanes teichomyceticus TaxID=1867 RepID=UPI000F0A303A|nr:hypothetical protein [Actinoplanes teichomyceticus]GIF13493.1 hypothetical protein Ate01nite_35250 [Actinoplanes teichomyceticus]